MKNKKYGLLAINSFNFITISMVLISVFLLTAPAISYFHAKAAFCSRVWALGAVFFERIFLFAIPYIRNI